MIVVEFTQRATESIETIWRAIAENSPTAADRFLEKVGDVRRLISEQPEAGRLTRRRGTRVLSLSAYPYKVFYRSVSDGRARIIDVRHARRRPMAWE